MITAANGVCVQPYTSGSTGRPKGVLLTHAGQTWNVDAVRRVLLLDESDRAVIAIPTFHANAAITLQVFLRAGGSLVINEGPFDPSAVLLSIAEHRCTFVGGLPAMFAALIEVRRAEPTLDVSCLRIAMVGSADVPATLSTAFGEVFGVSLGEGCGLTEGGPYAITHSAMGVRRRGSAGLPLPGCELEIRALGDSADRLGAGDVGELWVRNPGVTVEFHGLGGCQ